MHPQLPLLTLLLAFLSLTHACVRVNALWTGAILDLALTDSVYPDDVRLLWFESYWSGRAPQTKINLRSNTAGFTAQIERIGGPDVARFVIHYQRPGFRGQFSLPTVGFDKAGTRMLGANVWGC